VRAVGAPLSLIELRVAGEDPSAQTLKERGMLVNAVVDFVAAGLRHQTRQMCEGA